MNKLKKVIIAYQGALLVCLLTVFAILPLFTPGFWPMHDDEQVGRLYELDNAVKNGHIPPRISTNLGFGYGYPLFNFYPSFVYYFAEIFVLVGFSYITSIELMIATGFLVTALFMYLFAKEYLGTVGAVVASVAYTYAPYHAVDVYVRGALPEFWSFAFIPAIFWAIKKLHDSGKTMYLVFLAFFVCFLILTHNLVALMSAFFIGAYCLYLFIRTEKKWELFRSVALGGLLGLLLSSYFWIPSYFEKQYTMIELLTTELADYTQHFVYIRQLWDSPWGYGGSLYGLDDGMSFQIGKIHIILAAIMGGISFYLMKKRRPYAPIILFFFLLFGLSVFFITFYSKPIWDIIQQFSYIQFPWRFLLFSVFSGSFLAGSVVLLVSSPTHKKVVAACIIVLMLFLYGGYFQPAKYFTEVTDEDYTRDEVIRWRTSIMAFEYVPYGIATKTSAVGTTIIDIEPSEVADGMYQVIEGDLIVEEITDKPHRKELSVTATESGILRLNTFSFPGWKVFRNGQEIEYNNDNKFKLITFPLPAGSHQITAEFTDTTIRMIGNLLSILGVIISLAIILRMIKPISKKSK